MFVTLDKFVVTDEAVNGNKECAEKVENKILHGVAQSVMAAERDILRRIDRTGGGSHELLRIGAHEAVVRIFEDLPERTQSQ